MANRTVANKAKNSPESRLSDAEATRLSREGFMGLDEVCKHLDIGKTTLWQLRKNGQLPFVRQGRKTSIPRLAVVEYGKRLLQKVN